MSSSGEGWRTPTTIIGVLGLLIALGGLLIALGAWLLPRAGETTTTPLQQRSAIEEPPPATSTDVPPTESSLSSAASQKASEPQTSTALDVQIRIRDGFAAGKDEAWEGDYEGGGPAFDVTVLSESGPLTDGCYLKWKVQERKGTKALRAGRTDTCDLIYPDRGLPTGSYKILVDVETDDGPAAQGQYEFAVVGRDN